MDIELLQQEKLIVSGSSVLKMMQNKSTPSIDLIVRESIQNSLDAALPNTDKVNVDFVFDKFDVESMANNFDTISNKLKSKYYNDNNYLAIKDSNTIGLTGDIRGNFDRNLNGQNLTKLVFHIMKAQDKEGAGGSWGIGKTVYYRIGVGLTIFYSRIKNDDGFYEERLVAALVEDETQNNGLLSDFKNNIGVAFFGERIEGTEKIQAITDQKQIHDLLKIFNISPYDNDKTGTVVIIPFVNEEKLLNHNMSSNNMWWLSSLEMCLKVSILRWYFPRMSDSYNYGPVLDVTINGEKLKTDKKNTLIFDKYMELYKAAFTSTYNSNIHKYLIERQVNVVDKKIGTFLYEVINRDELGNNPNIYQYCSLDENDEQRGALIAYTRKPGMIVNYKLENYKSKNDDEFIIGLFVLNSNNSIKKPVEINLDEYVRSSEKADHSSWEDYTLDGGNRLLIIKNLFDDISRILSSEFGVISDKPGDMKPEFGLAKRFAKLLLPDYDFGHDVGGTSTGRNGHRPGGGVVKNKKYSVYLDSQSFDKGKMNMVYVIEIKEHISKLKIKHQIYTTNGWVNVYDDDIKMIAGSKMNRVAIKCEQINKKGLKDNYFDIVDINKFVNRKEYTITPLDYNGVFHELDITFDKSVKSIDLVVKIELDVVDSLMQTGFAFDVLD